MTSTREPVSWSIRISGELTRSGEGSVGLLRSPGADPLEGGQQVHRQREDHGRVLVAADLEQGLEVADEIVQVAKDQQADLVVIGSRGLAGKTRSFLGSTASQVVTYSPCSVLVVKTQD